MAKWILGLLCLLASAQAFPCADPYIVRKGDSLWELSGLMLRDPLRWREIKGQNSFLWEPGRYYSVGGHEHVLIKPEEQLCGPRPSELSSLQGGVRFIV